MKFIILVFSLFIFLVQSPTSSAAQLYAGLGVFGQNIGKTTRVSTAETSRFGTIIPEFGLMYFLPFLPFSISGNYTVVGDDLPDDTATARLLTFAGTYHYDVGSVLDLKGGLGIWNHFLFGEGGTVTLNNGSSTQDFARPSETVATSVLFLDVGFGLRFLDRFRLDVDAYITGPLSSRRSLNMLMQLSVGFL